MTGADGALDLNERAADAGHVHAGLGSAVLRSTQAVWPSFLLVSGFPLRGDNTGAPGRRQPAASRPRCCVSRAAPLTAEDHRAHRRSLAAGHRTPQGIGPRSPLSGRGRAAHPAAYGRCGGCSETARTAPTSPCLTAEHEPAGNGIQRQVAPRCSRVTDAGRYGSAHHARTGNRLPEAKPARRPSAGLAHDQGSFRSASGAHVMTS
jgi:hypothetical protein